MGGRSTPGERFDDSLLREIREETGLSASIGNAFHIDEWRPVVRDEHWHVVGTYIECHVMTDTVKLSVDHDEYIWIDPKNHQDYPLIESIHKAFESYLQFRN